ncbi:MAG TPA: isoprenylcysteine carboxylmethyltransferase family protein [Candidatus Limnocylindrales bacterium]
MSAPTQEPGKAADTEPERRRGPGLRWLAAGYLGLAGFFALEASVRRGGAASDLSTTTADDGTTGTVVAAFAAGLVLVPIARGTIRGRLPHAAGPLGMAVEAAGICLRLWSMRTLGAAYTRVLRADVAPSVVEDGPYRLVRHPGYLGSLTAWGGFALASGSPAAVVLAGVIFGRAYARRIEAEERLLVRDLPGYAEYRRRTWRLVPRVW